MLITAAGAAWSVLAQVTASRMLGAAATNERVNSSSSADSPSQESLRRSGIRTLCTSPASSVR
jgi:hypothetical protein